MSVYSDFCKYIGDTLFDESMKGGYVSFVIDDQFINDACKALDISKKGLFDAVRFFMFNSPDHVLRNHPFMSVGIIVIQLYATYIRGSDNISSAGYRLALGNLLNFCVEDIESWLSHYQITVWTAIYRWCSQNDFEVIHTEDHSGPWRYIRYPLACARHTLNQRDLKCFSYDFFIHGLSPKEDISEKDFWRALGGKSEITRKWWHTQRSKDILDNNYNNESVFAQIYTYFVFRWNGFYDNPNLTKCKQFISYNKYRLYISQNQRRVEVRDENFDKVFEVDISNLDVNTLSDYYKDKRSGIILFKPNDNYDNYWEETRYIDNADYGIALLRKDKYRIFIHQVIANYGKWKLVSFNKNDSTTDFFAAEQKPYKIEGGLKLGLRKYLLDGEPMIRVYNNAVKFWIDGQIYNNDKPCTYTFHLEEGEHVIKFSGYNPVSIFIINPQRKEPSWKNTYFRWEVNLEESYVKPVAGTSESGVKFIGLDFRQMMSDNVPVAEQQLEPIIQRWILAHQGIGNNNETNVVIKQLKAINSNGRNNRF